ncbi:unnamed protein product [Musa acuminata subsp. burmannicoides]
MIVLQMVDDEGAQEEEGGAPSPLEFSIQAIGYHFARAAVLVLIASFFDGSA